MLSAKSHFPTLSDLHHLDLLLPTFHIDATDTSDVSRWLVRGHTPRGEDCCMAFTDTDALYRWQPADCRYIEVAAMGVYQQAVAWQVDFLELNPAGVNRIRVPRAVLLDLINSAL